MVAEYKPGSHSAAEAQSKLLEDKMRRGASCRIWMRSGSTSSRIAISKCCRFKRNEIDLINSLDSEYFDKMASCSPQLVHDAGRFAG